MKYHCIDCDKDFDESSDILEIKGKLIRILFVRCPNCNNSNVCLSENGKKMVERKAKINKIETTNSFL
jgi:DNA-directed RNA polymerase subunit RPC12/RpoP